MKKRSLFALPVFLFLFISFFPPVVVADLDCGMPPGTPIEWDKDFPKPTPTPRGKVPVLTEGYKRQKMQRQHPQVAPKHGHAHQTGVLHNPVKPPKMDFSVQNLYAYFGITTVDIMNHLKVSIPEVTRFPSSVGEDDRRTGPVITGKNVPKRAPGATAWTIQWNYQPEYPVELVWDAVTCALRLIMHPEIISYPEIKAHLLALGVPAGIGCAAIPRPGAPMPQNARVPGGNKPANNGAAFRLMGEIQQCVGSLPGNTPSVPPVSPRTPMNVMLAKLAAVEFTGGYPSMMDPNYARRILSLGKEGLPAVIACLNTNHTFLKRNAIAAIANYHDKKAEKVLRKYVNSNDLVMRVRAIRGLMRFRSRANISFFEKLLRSNDPMMQALGCFGLGSYKSTSSLKKLMGAFNSAVKRNNRDFMWSLLPAITRCASSDAKGAKMYAKILRAASRRFAASFPGPNAPDAGGEVPAPQNPAKPNVRILGQRAAKPEKVGFKNVIMWQMVQCALAAMGEQNEIDNVLNRLKSMGLAKAFHKANWFLVIDALARMPANKGIEQLKNIVGETSVPENVRVWAVKRIAESNAVGADWFKEIATSGSGYTVRAQAVISLSQKSGDIAKETCQEIMKLFTSAPSDGSQAFFYTAVLQIGGQLSAFKAETLYKVCQACFDAKAYAKRQGNNDPDITKANISIYPPLLETSILELGRTGYEKAMDLFIKILQADMPNGSPEAALALGVFKKKAAAAALLKTLEDSKDGWARFCAYKALKMMSGEDHFTDYIFGSKDRREDQIAFYKDWFDKYFK